jgi:hypothetical protein
MDVLLLLFSFGCGLVILVAGIMIGKIPWLDRKGGPMDPKRVRMIKWLIIGIGGLVALMTGGLLLGFVYAVIQGD